MSATATAAVALDTRISNPAKQSIHSSSNRYICPLPVWCLLWDENRFQFDENIIRQSTVAVGAREDWPHVYIGHHSPHETETLAIADFTAVTEIVEHMNKLIKSFWTEILELNEIEIQKLFIILFKMYGFWTDIIHPIEQMQIAEPSHRNTIPPPRKPRGRNSGKKHIIARKVDRAQQKGQSCDRRESSPVPATPQKPPTNHNRIKQSEQDKQNAIKTASVQREQQKQKQLEEQLITEADEYLESIVGNLVDDGILGGKDKPKTKPAKNVGKCIKPAIARTICEQLTSQYKEDGTPLTNAERKLVNVKRLKPITIAASERHNVVLAENIYVDGDKVSSKVADNIRRFVSRAVKRHTAAQTGKPK